MSVQKQSKETYCNKQERGGDTISAPQVEVKLYLAKMSKIVNCFLLLTALATVVVVMYCVYSNTSFETLGNGFAYLCYWGMLSGGIFFHCYVSSYTYLQFKDSTLIHFSLFNPIFHGCFVRKFRFEQLRELHVHFSERKGYVIAMEDRKGDYTTLEISCRNEEFQPFLEAFLQYFNSVQSPDATIYPETRAMVCCAENYHKEIEMGFDVLLKHRAEVYVDGRLAGKLEYYTQSVIVDARKWSTLVVCSENYIHMYHLLPKMYVLDEPKITTRYPRKDEIPKRELPYSEKADTPEMGYDVISLGSGLRLLLLTLWKTITTIVWCALYLALICASSIGLIVLPIYSKLIPVLWEVYVMR